MATEEEREFRLRRLEYDIHEMQIAGIMQMWKSVIQMMEEWNAFWLRMAENYFQGLNRK